MHVLEMILKWLLKSFRSTPLVIKKMNNFMYILKSLKFILKEGRKQVSEWF